MEISVSELKIHLVNLASQHQPRLLASLISIIRFRVLQKDHRPSMRRGIVLEEADQKGRMGSGALGNVRKFDFGRTGTRPR